MAERSPTDAPPRGRGRRVALVVAGLLLVLALFTWRDVARWGLFTMYGWGDIWHRLDCDATAIADGRPIVERPGCFVAVPGLPLLDSLERTGKPWAYGGPLTFLMGAQADDPDGPAYDPDASEDEGPPHLVTIRPFWLQRYEVSLEQFRWCVRLGPCSEDDVGHGGYFEYGREDRDGYPVNGVTWEGARRYCEWLGGRLPTEAEWEFVAHGGPHGLPHPWGEQEMTCNHAVFGGAESACARTSAAAAGHWPQAGLDLYHRTVNLVGNVWEWQADWFDPAGYGGDAGAAALVDPRGPAAGTGRVQRGGGWSDDDPAMFRATFRAQMAPDSKLPDVGFRCAADTVDEVSEASQALLPLFSEHGRGW